jgi:hypothetical protein
MTPNDFRKLALSFPATAEHDHMNHPDFRVAGKIFATLGYPNKEHAMVKVTPVEQEMLVSAEPLVFTPVKGAWGLKGCTSVNLEAAAKTTLHRALSAAWHLAAPQILSREFPDEAISGANGTLSGKTAKTARQKGRRSRKSRANAGKRG